VRQSHRLASAVSERNLRYARILRELIEALNGRKPTEIEKREILATVQAWIYSKDRTACA
jgi:hypothetical protein